MRRGRGERAGRLGRRETEGPPQGRDTGEDGGIPEDHPLYDVWG